MLDGEEIFDSFSFEDGECLGVGDVVREKAVVFGVGLHDPLLTKLGFALLFVSILGSLPFHE